MRDRLEGTVNLSSSEAAGGFGPWLNPLQAVRYLGLPSLKALYQAVRRGQIPAHRLGLKRLRFNKHELDELMASK